MRDLDYWADEPADDGDDDDDPMPVCSACKGSGKAADGTECLVCGGAEAQPIHSDGRPGGRNR